ncbi:hypothetical protein [Pseudomonas entomophila]|uniref:hypothetical protein n=1 Tax=Pseudomonas entomophila TaxID=312306 RepID=UPI003EB95AB3
MPAPHCYINAAQIVVFSPSIAATLKADLLHSSLLAQLLADKAAFTTLSDWHHHYTSALARTQWMRMSATVHSITPDEPAVTLTELIDASSLPSSAKAMLRHTLDALRQPANASALSILRNAVCKPHDGLPSHNLWFELVQVTDASDIRTFALTVEAPGAALTSDASDHVFDTMPEGARFTLRTSQFELMPTYDGIRTKVIRALGDKANRYTAVVESSHDMPPVPKPSVPALDDFAVR